ncbi:MAG: ROK family protein [Rikenellaceae bacterium]
MKKISFGIDIGGINTVVGLVDDEGNIYTEGGIPTSKYPHFSDYKNYVTDLAAEMQRQLDTLDMEYELMGVGIGAPNANYHDSAIITPPNLWKYTEEEEEKEASEVDTQRIFHLCDDLQKAMPSLKSAAITNDANAATIGEMLFGNGKGLSDFIMITLGTGLGSGFVANGKMIYGHDGFAGEAGHMIVVPNGRECGCGRKGCLEAYVSATGIKRTAFEVMAQMRVDSPLRKVAYDDFDSLLISKAAMAGDPLALEIFRYTAEMLGVALANIATITSPKAIILFGGLAKAGDLIFEPTKKYMEENMLFTYKNKVDILPSGIQDKNIAIIGAASLILSE